MRYKILATQIIQDFNRRGICPDWEYQVNQGNIKLWRLGQELLPELHIGKTIITGKYSYINTLSPQDIANDLMKESALSPLDLELINGMSIQVEWLTTVEIEEKYELPKGSVRRDIHRGKFQEHEIKKVGRDWTVNMNSADKLYGKQDVDFK